jgi:hypothetical protein
MKQLSFSLFFFSKNKFHCFLNMFIFNDSYCILTIVFRIIFRQICLIDFFSKLIYIFWNYCFYGINVVTTSCLSDLSKRYCTSFFRHSPGSCKNSVTDCNHPYFRKSVFLIRRFIPIRLLDWTYFRALFLFIA